MADAITPGPAVFITVGSPHRATVEVIHVDGESAWVRIGGSNRVVPIERLRPIEWSCYQVGERARSYGDRPGEVIASGPTHVAFRSDDGGFYVVAQENLTPDTDKITEV